MEKITYGGIAGRKPRLVQLENGEMVVVKKMFKIGNGYAILLPTEWLSVLDSQGILKSADYQFSLYYDDEKLILEPLKEKIEGKVY